MTKHCIDPNCDRNSIIGDMGSDRGENRVSDRAANLAYSTSIEKLGS
jgi:hypothetical protein